MDEFSLIERYFNWQQPDLIDLGVGDDGAIINVDAKYQLVTSVDTLIKGVHFPIEAKATDIAYKALAVSLSDLAAMGATPYYFTLALTLPDIHVAWLKEFSTTLRLLADEFNITLVGGDTTKGDLSISINATGVVKKDKALLRSAAQPGDVIYVSNYIGDAAYAWQQIQNKQTPSQSSFSQFNRPKPQVVLGQALIGVANACIDVSDGLEQDLGHILKRSGVGAVINLTDIPLSNEVSVYVQKTNDWCLVLGGGDDYQLCFTVPKKNIKALNMLSGIQITPIGVIDDSMVLNRVGIFTDKCNSYQHFLAK